MTKGVTLVELIIILLLLGILAIVTIPRLITVSEFRREAALNRVKADLKYVKEYAVNNSLRTRISYDLTGNTSYIATQYISNSWQDMIDPTTNTSPFTVTLNTGNYAGIRIESANFDSQTTVEFDHIGRPYSYNGSISTLLLNDGVISLTGPVTINITRDTGRID